MRCNAETYVSWWTDEDGDEHSAAECNAGPGGDCGFSEPFDVTFGITSDEMDEIHTRHLAHLRAE